MKTTLFYFILALLIPQIIWGAECRIKTEREPCKGQEQEALEPYNLKQNTEEVFQLKNVDLCLQKAKKSAKIVREGTIAKKTVTVHFAGQKLEQSFTDSQACH